MLRAVVLGAYAFLSKCPRGCFCVQCSAVTLVTNSVVWVLESAARRNRCERAMVGDDSAPCERDGIIDAVVVEVDGVRVDGARVEGRELARASLPSRVELGRVRVDGARASRARRRKRRSGLRGLAAVAGLAYAFLR